MLKSFYDVFPTLNLSEQARSIMEYTQVSRVTMNRERTFMRVYLESDKLIY